MLEMEAGPQKIAKGALIRRDIWERLQVHWLHAREILQNWCQLKCIPVLWTHVVQGDKCGDHGGHVQALVRLQRIVDGSSVLSSTGSCRPSCLWAWPCAPGLVF